MSDQQPIEPRTPGTPPKPPEPKPGVVDLMAALRASLQQAAKRRAARTDPDRDEWIDTSPGVFRIGLPEQHPWLERLRHAVLLAAGAVLAGVVAWAGIGVALGVTA